MTRTPKMAEPGEQFENVPLLIFLNGNITVFLKTTLVLSGDIANCYLKLILTQADHKYLLKFFLSSHLHLNIGIYD